MINYAWLIPVIPFLSFLLILLFGRVFKTKSAAIAIAGIFISFMLSLAILFEVLKGVEAEIKFSWITTGSWQLDMGFLIDPLAAVMLVVVTLVSLLVQVYSLGYMKGDKGFSWYYGALSLFTFSMLSLVLANNYLMLYIFWELVGLCSYLLIGFWFEKKSASDAAKKAFIVTRIGDVGLLLGILLLFTTVGTLNYNMLFSLAEAGAFSPLFLTTATLLLFAGAVGKSAQFPLHVWLPDAMEGPTPVSALIHAATMVAAGVYLTARSFPLFELSSSSLLVVGILGAITCLMAATIATVINDIKKILAYSTISQLGYMMMALGAGAVGASIFHLFTHAFFKALLFLGAGSVIHATHTQDITQMGGLAKKMKITSLTFVIGALSLSGIFPLAGFWSKDEILASLSLSQNYPILLVGLATVFLTAFYMFRLCFLAFFGKEQEKLHAHESPLNMTAPLSILAFLAIFAGFLGSPLTQNSFARFLSPEHEIHPLNISLMLLSSAIALFGIFLAWTLYHRKLFRLDTLMKKVSFLHVLLSRKYYIDEIYTYGIVKPVVGIGLLSYQFDARIIDGLVNGVSWVTLRLANIGARFDLKVVDGAVNGVAQLTGTTGDRLRYIQTGYIQNYAAVIFAALIVLVVWFVF